MHTLTQRNPLQMTKMVNRKSSTKDVNSVKTRINQLITMQHNQQETLVHVMSILNVTSEPPR